MASWLDEYQNIKTDMERDFNDAVPAVEQLIVYQELIYRIGVLRRQRSCAAAHQLPRTPKRSSGTTSL